jgi:asparagine synthase (glutamine-hydrolysing)
MCGIAGCILPSGSASLLNWPHFARSALAHRGPDDSGVFVDQSHGIGLVHTRLAILDLSPLGHQPMSSADGRWQLVFNGEIYNFQELRQELLASGVAFRGQSDTEVLLALWQARGAACLSQLNGMFAFAIWDALERELVVVRDSSGIKPLFYAQLSQGLIFASEAKALAPLLPPLPQLHADHLLRQLSYLWCPGPGTLHPLIQSLEPGTLLLCRPGEPVALSRWCAPIPPTRPQLRHPQAATQATLAHLRTAVHRQMVADVPLGAFLSGGLDSSAVVALARERDPQLQCFTIVNPGAAEVGFDDDLPYARRVARHLGVSLTEVEIQPSYLAADLRWLLAQLDAPVADPAPLNVVHICRAACRQGIKVLLSGAGGDDLFTGYRRHLALQAEMLWGWWPRPLRRGLWLASGRLSQISAPGRRLARSFELADADPEQRLIHYFRWGTPARLRRLLSEPLQRQLQDPNASAPLQDWLAQLPPGLSRLQQMLALEQRFFLADHNLHYTDAMSMAAGVEVRVPFLDPELLALSWRLPDRFKQRGRCGKWVLKQAMAGLLPHDVIHRPKTGFGAPLRRWLQLDLHALVVDTLSPSRLTAGGLFNPSAVEQLLDDQRSGRIDASYTIWSLLCIALWWERHKGGVV